LDKIYPLPQMRTVPVSLSGGMFFHPDGLTKPQNGGRLRYLFSADAMFGRDKKDHAPTCPH